MINTDTFLTALYMMRCKSTTDHGAGRTELALTVPLKEVPIARNRSQIVPRQRVIYTRDLQDVDRSAWPTNLLYTDRWLIRL